MFLEVSCNAFEANQQLTTKTFRRFRRHSSSSRLIYQRHRCSPTRTRRRSSLRSLFRQSLPNSMVTRPKSLVRRSNGIILPPYRRTLSYTLSGSQRTILWKRRTRRLSTFHSGESSYQTVRTPVIITPSQRLTCRC